MAPVISKMSVTCVSEPKTPEGIRLSQKCQRGTSVYSHGILKEGFFSLGSLVFECDDYSKIWNLLAFKDKKVDVEELLKFNQETVNKTPRCRHSLYSLIFCSFLRKDFAAQVSQANLSYALEAKFRVVDGDLAVDETLTDCYLDNWLDVFVSLQTISKVYNNADNQPNMEVYMSVVKEIVKHPMWTQKMLEDACNLRCGPLINLATKLTVENINWMMNKLKLTTSVNFLHQLFCSPSVMGKCAALFQLLEIHELLWRSINVASLESLIPTLYTIIEWVFEKCRAAKNYVISGFSWVSAKFRRGEHEENKYPTIRPDLPETSTKATAECETPITISHQLVSKGKFVNDILNVTAKAQACTSYANNCLLEAVADGTELDPKLLRDQCLELLTEHPEKLQEDFLANGFTVQDFEKEITELLSQLNSGKTLGASLFPVLENLVGKKIVGYVLQDDKYISYENAVSQFSDVIYIENKRLAHWVRVSEMQNVSKFNIFGGSIEEAIIVENTDNLTEEICAQTNIPQAQVEEMVTTLDSTPLGRTFLEWLKDAVGDIYQFFRKNAIIGGIIAFAFSMTAAFGIGISKFKTYGDKRSFWENVSGASRDFYHLSQGQNSMTKVLTDFGQILKTMLNLDDQPEITEFKKALLATAERAEELNKFCQFQPEEITNDPQKLNVLKCELDEMRKRYHELTKYGPQVNLQSLAPIWTRVTAAYAMLQANHAKICNRSERRVTPVCVWFWGKSNIGKSELISHFVNEVNRAQGTAWEVFTVSKGPEYLNGFNQQKILLIDDFDSFSMVEGCLDALLVMNMKTSAPYNPNLASLEDKLLQARPSMIIISSNFQTAKLNCGVNDMLAFERRRDMLINVKWEGSHEKCDVTDTDCEHWKKVKLDASGNPKERLTFDHLSCYVNHPLVYSNPKIFSNPPKLLARNVTAPVLKENKVMGGEKISIEALVTATIEKMRSYEAVHKAAMAELNAVKEYAVKKLREAKAEAADLSNCIEENIEDWKKIPNILLRGPPGTGKSQALKQLEKSGVKCKYIQDLATFNSAYSTQWNFPGCDFVLFDDYTTFKDSPYRKEFWTLWKRRVDLGDIHNPVWIMGMNDCVAISTFDTYEEFDVMTRADRAHSYFFKYNAKPRGMFDFFSAAQFYVADDVKDFPDDKTYGDIITITDAVSENRVLFDGLVKDLARWKPERRAKSSQVVLPVIHHMNIDAVSKVAATTKEFIDIVNTTGTSQKAIGMLLDSSFQSHKFSKLDIGKRIATTFMRMTSYHNSHFYDMDEFILSGSNSGFFNAFNDGDFVLEFKDRSYCLTTVGGRVVAGIYDPVDLRGDMSKCLGSLVQSINTFDFLKVTKSSLPPWFVVATAVLESVVKFASTGLFIPHTIKQNRVTFKATIMEDKIEEVKETFVDRSYEKTAKDSADKLLNDNVPEKPKLVPVIPVSVPESPKNREDEIEKKKQQVQKKAVSKPAHRAARYNNPRGQCQMTYDKAGNAICEASFEVKEADNKTDFGAAAAIMTNTLTAKVPAAEAELSTDVAVFDVINVVAKNMVNIERLDGTFVLHGLMIKGRTGTTTSHVTAKYEASQLRVRTWKGETFLIRFVRIDKSIDLLDFEIAGNHQFPDISKHLSQPEMNYFGCRLGVMVSMKHVADDLSMMTLRYYRIKAYQRVQLEGLYEVQAWSYGGGLSGFISEMPPQTKAGDCGSVMFLCDSSRERKVIGMHIASNDTTGFFRPVTYTQYPPNVQAQAENFTGYDGEFMEPYYEKDNDGHDVIARCVRTPHVADKTRLYRSPFQYGECQYEPSVLSRGDPRAPEIDDMVRKEAYKWLEPPIELSAQRKQKIRDRFTMLGDWLGQKCSAYGIETSVLTKRDALNSVKGFRHSKPIPVGTSPGYPMNQKIGRGKIDLIHVNEADGSRNFTNDISKKALFHKSIDHVLNRAKLGLSADVAYSIFVKDELLKKEKLSHKTRTIAAAPLGLVVSLRMYFHTIYAALAEIWNVQPVKVGISPTSLDWHELALSLLRIGNRGFSLDQTDFDFNVPKELSEGVVYALDAIAGLTDPHYSDSDRKMRIALHENVSNFNIIVRGLVYNVTRGVPSGHPGTAVENSLISLFCLYDAFCELAPSYALTTVEAFFAQVAPAVYGDDALVIVHQTIEQWFNMQTVCEYLSSTYGMVLTTADKSNERYTVKPLKDLTFLSRGFHRLDAYWIGPLEMKRLIKPLNFCAGKRSHHWFKEPDLLTDDPENAVAAARSALDEMFFYGEKEYNKLRVHCLRVVRDLGVSDMFFPSYKDAYMNFFDLNLGESQTLYLYNFPVQHSIVSRINQETGWINYGNRRCCLFGPAYSWDKKTANIQPNEIPLYMANILRQVNNLTNENFNQILVNEYRPGGCIPYHKDDEPGLDLEAGVASVTIIGDGIVSWCDVNGKLVHSELMAPGTMYHMQGKYVDTYKHKRDQHEKYTLTFTFRRVSSS